MKPALPDQFIFNSEDKKITLKYNPQKDPTVKIGTSSFTWKDVRPKYPTQVILSNDLSLAFFIGGYGDPGVSLGRISVYELKTGKLLKEYDLTQQIQNMEEKSRQFKNSTNFPWLTDAKMSTDGTQLELVIFENILAFINPKLESVQVKLPLKWFEKFGCEELHISQYKTLKTKKPSFKIIINDREFIRSLQSQINQLPTEGDMMVDFSADVEFVNLEFTCGSEKETIEFYDGRIKTPATSFYIRSNKLESPIWNELNNLWSEKGAYSSRVTYFEGFRKEFPDFFITYLGKEDQTPPGTTATSIVQKFEIQGRTSNNKLFLEVRSGQLPPKPLEFSFENKKYILHTYIFEKDRIYPLQLVVTQVKP